MFDLISTPKKNLPEVDGEDMGRSRAVSPAGENQALFVLRNEMWWVLVAQMGISLTVNHGVHMA